MSLGHKEARPSSKETRFSGLPPGSAHGLSSRERVIPEAQFPVLPFLGSAGPLQLADTGLSEEQLEQMDEAHTRTQVALTQGSQNAEQIVAEDSGHYIQVEQPDLVIDAIRQVVEAARNGGSRV